MTNPARGISTGWLIGLGVALSLLLAGVASYYASSAPDGLERVATDLGFASDAGDSAVAGSPLADYGVAGLADPRLSVGLSGVVGVALTAAVAFGLFWLLGRRRPRSPAQADTP